jgi:hypothetical protein
MIEILRESFSLVFLESIWQAISVSWFVVLPLTLYFLFKLLWMDFAQGNFWSNVEWVMLEIVPPNDIEETPQAMEMIYSGMLGAMKGINAIEEFVNGEEPMYYSLELVSDEGQVHFYIRTPKSFVKLIESNFHAQYPQSEVKIVEDYVHDIPKVIPNKDWNLWGTDFKLDKPDPYPIKSYRWFEEDITGKSLDPLASIIESIGKIGPAQKFWLQLIITPKDSGQYDTGRELANELAGREVKKSRGFLEGVLGDIGDIILGIFKTIGGNPPEEAFSESSPEDVPIEYKMTPGERDVLKMIEEGIGKIAFNVKMRIIYAGRRESFDKSVIGSFAGGLKQLSDINTNGFAMDNDTKTFALHLFVDKRMRYRQRKILRRYRDRDKSGKTFHLNTEELATVFHLPNMSVITPSFRKVETKTGSAPSNLPIE